MSGPDKKKIYSGVQHADEEKSKDFTTTREAKDAAKQHYDAIQQSVAGLNAALKDAGAGHLTYDFDPFLTKSESNRLVVSTGGTAVAGLAIAATASPVIGMGVVVGNIVRFVTKGIIDGSDSHIRHLIKQDFKGKHEAEILYALPDGSTLKMPVTPENLAVTAKAYEAATAYVRDAQSAHFAGNLEEGVRKAMLSYIAGHAQGAIKEPVRGTLAMPFSKEDVAFAAPIRGGAEVTGEPVSGLTGAKPATTAQRSV